MRVEVDKAKAALDKGFANLKSNAVSWFNQVVDSTFPMLTGALRKDYKRNFGKNPVSFSIGSNLPYAKRIEALDSANWTFSGTIPHAAAEAGRQLANTMMKILIKRSF